MANTILADKNVTLAPSQIDADLAKKASEIFNSLSFPTRKSEDWRYARLGPLIKRTYTESKVTSVDINPFLIKGLDDNVMVFINGLYNKELSKTAPNSGIVIASILDQTNKPLINEYYNKLSSDNDIFSTLNTGYCNGGAFIHSAKNSVSKKPIHLLHISTSGEMHYNVRNLIIAEPNTELEIIQSFHSYGENQNFNNTVTEVFVQQNAKVAITKVQNDDAKASHICTEEVYQERDSTFKMHTYVKSGKLVRNGLNIKVDGENCYTEMNGLALMKNDQYIDNHTKVDHLKPHCVSSELYKNILKDKSVGVFNGKVIVHPNAQKIEAYQQNNNVIVSDSATMNAKPELEIYADDVKCSHGTTTGQFDESAIFYLQTRGLNKQTAKEKLIKAFAQEVMDKIDNSMIREYISEMYR